MLALYGIFTCKLQNHSTVVLNNMLQYYKKTNIHILTLRNSYKVKEHVLGHLLSGLFRSYCNPSLTVSRLFIRNSNYYIVRQNGPTPRQFGTNVLISINKEKCQLLLTSVVNRTEARFGIIRYSVRFGSVLFCLVFSGKPTEYL